MPHNNENKRHTAESMMCTFLYCILKLFQAYMRTVRAISSLNFNNILLPLVMATAAALANRRLKINCHIFSFPRFLFILAPQLLLLLWVLVWVLMEKPDKKTHYYCISLVTLSPPAASTVVLDIPFILKTSLILLPLAALISSEYTKRKTWGKWTLVVLVQNLHW